MSPTAISAATLDELRPRLTEALAGHSCVLTAPTGVGKSTQVPRWLAGKTLVIEPRRVACQSLARRVAELEGAQLGKEVGYRVRDDDRATPSSRIVFVTPGIVLRDPRWALAFDHIVLDEFHERRLDTDWLYAYLKLHERKLLVMSATIAAERIANDLHARLFQVEQRSYPVDIRYLGQPADLPGSCDWAALAASAIAKLPKDSGDVLVFLPGKGEIERLCDAIDPSAGELLALHGSLPLSQQARVFEASARRKIVLATNVAETSLTLPGVEIVIDTGLVRRTHFHAGRSTLALTPIAKDSATQRAGRAGRTGPGTCLRLWGSAAQLAPQTPPEIHREELSEFVLWSAAAGLDAAELPCLDPPKPAALELATAELRALGALDAEGRITEGGRRLHGLPLDAWYGRLLIEAQARGNLHDCIDLVAALAHTPRIQLPAVGEPEKELACDAVPLIYAVRREFPGARVQARRELERSRERLRALMKVEGEAPARVDRDALIRTILAADPRAAHVGRRRKRHLYWAAGSTELELGRESRAQAATESQALVVLETHTTGLGKRRKVIATRASAIDLKLLDRLGFGEERVLSVSTKGGRLTARVERVYVGKVLSSSERAPTGQTARDALTELLLSGRLFAEQVQETRRRLQRRRLCYQLSKAPAYAHLGFEDFPEPPELESWIRERVVQLGFESGEDMALLSGEDFLVEDVPAELQPTLDGEFPLEVNMGDCLYRVDYDFARKQVLLCMVKGQRTQPPPANFLPKFRGFRICAEAGGRVHVIRAARR
jgi:HrpA-like RNA helicase